MAGEEIELRLFDIQRFSWHDGPGIRTVVFLKGCNLRCGWCHNPESQASGPELMLYEEHCIGCGRCVAACPRGCHRLDPPTPFNLPPDGDGKEGGVRHAFERAGCVACGACAEACWSDALRLTGRTMTVEAVAQEVLRDAGFYRRSGGGVTLSGGEPLLQAEGCRALLERLRASGTQLTTAVDTAGSVPWSAFEAVLPLLDYVLYDLKAMDDGLHRRHTGASNRLILENLRRLRGAAAQVIVRVPVIPGVNDTEAEAAAIERELQGYPNLLRVERLPYHTIGAPKYRALGRECEEYGV